jgi:hypothetical protein
MVKAGEKSTERVVIKRTASRIDMYCLYFSQLSVLGMRLTKVQIRILANIALHYPTKELGTAERKKITDLVGTTSQVIENTLTVLRKKGIIQDNMLSPKYRVDLFDGYKLSIVFKDEA